MSFTNKETYPQTQVDSSFWDFGTHTHTQILRFLYTHIEILRYTLRLLYTHIEILIHTYWESYTHIQILMYTYWDSIIHILRFLFTHIEILVHTLRFSCKHIEILVYIHSYSHIHISRITHIQIEILMHTHWAHSRGWFLEMAHLCQIVTWPMTLQSLIGGVTLEPQLWEKEGQKVSYFLLVFTL